MPKYNGAPSGASDARRRKSPALFGAVKLADLLTPRLQGRFRWCKELGWLHFNGAKWCADADQEALTAVVDALKAHTHAAVEKSGLNAELVKELRDLSQPSAQTHALKIARGAPGILTDVAAFDPQPAPGRPWLVPCENGITVELYADGSRKTRATRPEDLNTHTVCAYYPKARAPRVAKAFRQYQPDVDVRRFMLQQWARGLSGMGSETFTVHLGEKGGNGKSTMQGLLQEVGGDYAVDLPVEVILKGQGSAREVYRSELAAVRGARLVFTDEPEEGARYNLGMLKKITGGGTLQGRQHFKGPVTFQPRILFQMPSNVRPYWTADGGMDRRYIEISWDFTVDKAAIQESFKEELKAEKSGFLNEILKHWMGAEPLELPDAVSNQTALGAKESSPAARFVDEAVIKSAGQFVSARLMYDAFVEWSKQNGFMRPMSSTKLGRELSRLGFDKEKRGTFQYLDVTISEEFMPRTAF